MNPRTFASVLTVVLLSATCGSGSADTTTTTTGNQSPSSTFYGTTSMPEDYDNDRVFGVFPSRPIASLTVQVRAYPDYGPDDAYCVFYGPGTGTTGFNGETTFTFSSLSKGELDRSQAAFNCSYYTHEPHGPLSWDDIRVTKVEAVDSDGLHVPTAICRLDSSWDEFALPGEGDCREACGDAICDGGEPTVLDALAVLKSALGSFPCEVRRCDANHDLVISAADALKVLRRAVQLRSVLLCWPSGYECEDLSGDWG